MSATETPLVTPDELNKILTRENADLRAREKVAKVANDAMRAELEKARELLGESLEKLELYAKRQGPTRMNSDKFSDGTHSNPNVGRHYPQVQSFASRVVNALGRCPKITFGRHKLKSPDILDASNPEADALRAQLATAEAKVAYVERMGLRFGMMKTTDKPEPYLAHVWDENSDHERMFAEWTASIDWEDKVAAANKRAEAAEARVRELSDRLDEWTRAHGVRVDEIRRLEARLDAVLGALERIVALGAAMPDEAEEVRIAKAALDAARTGDASKYAPKTNTSAQRAVDTSGDAAHSDSRSMTDEEKAAADAFFLSHFKPAAHPDSDRLRYIALGWWHLFHHSARTDGDNWRDDFIGSLDRLIARDKATNFTPSAKAGAGVDASSAKLANLVKEAQIVVDWAMEPPEDWPVAKRIEYREDVAALETAIKAAKAGGGVDVAALLEDKARLDWLEKHEACKNFVCQGFHREDGSYAVGQWMNLRSGHPRLMDSAQPTLRAAIDAARNAGAASSGKEGA